MFKHKCIRKACSITDDIFSELIKNFKKFKTEKEAAAHIYSCIRKRNLRPSFPVIVAVGKSGANPHHVPGDALLKKGFCVIDFGVRVNSFCSDMTRTVYLGSPSKKEAYLYGLVLKVQKQCIQRLKEGVYYRDIDLFARKAFGRYSSYFIHSLGHGVGRKIHQKPLISSASKDKIKPGDIVTIEPGLYFKGRFGIRVEDDIIVTENGPVVISNSSRRLIKLKRP